MNLFGKGEKTERSFLTLFFYRLRYLSMHKNTLRVIVESHHSESKVNWWLNHQSSSNFISFSRQFTKSRKKMLKNVWKDALKIRNNYSFFFRFRMSPRNFNFYRNSSKLAKFCNNFETEKKNWSFLLKINNQKIIILKLNEKNMNLKV